MNTSTTTEVVYSRAVLTAHDPKRNTDKIYIVEVVETPVGSGNHRWLARARYGRNDGRKLRVVRLYNGTGRWAAVAACNEKVEAKTREVVPRGHWRAKPAEYARADSLVALAIVAADNALQGIEQTEAA